MAFPLAPIFRALPLEIMIERVEPFMSKSASSPGLGEINYHLARLIVCRGPAVPARAKADRQFTVEGHCLGWHAHDVGQVVQRVKGFVKHSLPFFHATPLGYPVAKFHAPESESVIEHFRRSILPLPVIRSRPGPVGLAAQIALLDVLALFNVLPRLHKVTVTVLNEIKGFLGAAKGLELPIKRIALFVDPYAAGVAAHFKLHFAFRRRLLVEHHPHFLGQLGQIRSVDIPSINPGAGKRRGHFFALLIAAGVRVILHARHPVPLAAVDRAQQPDFIRKPFQLVAIHPIKDRSKPLLLGVLHQSAHKLHCLHPSRHLVALPWLGRHLSAQCVRHCRKLWILNPVHLRLGPDLRKRLVGQIAVTEFLGERRCAIFPRLPYLFSKVLEPALCRCLRVHLGITKQISPR